MAVVSYQDATRIYPGTKHSLSSNDALQGRNFIGRVVATFANGQVMIN